MDPQVKIKTLIMCTKFLLILLKFQNYFWKSRQLKKKEVLFEVFHGERVKCSFMQEIWRVLYRKVKRTTKASKRGKKIREINKEIENTGNPFYLLVCYSRFWLSEDYELCTKIVICGFVTQLSTNWVLFKGKQDH